MPQIVGVSPILVEGLDLLALLLPVDSYFTIHWVHCWYLEVQTIRRPTCEQLGPGAGQHLQGTSKRNFEFSILEYRRYVTSVSAPVQATRTRPGDNRALQGIA